MLSLNTYNPFETSLDNAKVVVSLNWLYQTVRKYVSKLSLMALVILLGLPFLFLAGLWLQLKRRGFQKHMRINKVEFNNADEYLNLKRTIKHLSSLKPVLTAVAKYKISKSPLLFRYTILQMKRMSSTLLTYHGWLNSRLVPLNEDLHKENGKVFRFVSERELWKHRNKAYKYWM